MVKFLDTGYIKITDAPGGGGAKYSTTKPSNFKRGKEITAEEFALASIEREDELEVVIDGTSEGKSRTRSVVSPERIEEELSKWLDTESV